MNTNPQPIRILVVDDHPMLRHGIVGLVGAQSDMTLVAEGRYRSYAIFDRHGKSFSRLMQDIAQVSKKPLVVCIPKELQSNGMTSNSAKKLWSRLLKVRAGWVVPRELLRDCASIEQP